MLVDALDSFTHNLAQAFAVAGAEVRVVTADPHDAGDARVASILAHEPDLCVLGPGPGHPAQAATHLAAVRALCGRVPLLGVCLGHQALALALGGRIVRHPPVHGRATPVHHDGTGVFSGVAPGAPMGRYHSLGVDAPSLPRELRITGWSDDGVVMGLAHRHAPAWSVQFHPESVLSGAAGMGVLRAFVARATGRRRLVG